MNRETNETLTALTVFRSRLEDTDETTQFTSFTEGLRATDDLTQPWVLVEVCLETGNVVNYRDYNIRLLH